MDTYPSATPDRRLAHLAQGLIVPFHCLDVPICGSQFTDGTSPRNPAIHEFDRRPTAGGDVPTEFRWLVLRFLGQRLRPSRIAARMAGSFHKANKSNCPG